MKIQKRTYTIHKQDLRWRAHEKGNPYSGRISVFERTEKLPLVSILDSPLTLFSRVMQGMRCKKTKRLLQGEKGEPTAIALFLAFDVISNLEAKWKGSGTYFRLMARELIGLYEKAENKPFEIGCSAQQPTSKLVKDFEDLSNEHMVKVFRAGGEIWQIYHKAKEAIETKINYTEREIQTRAFFLECVEKATIGNELSVPTKKQVEDEWFKMGVFQNKYEGELSCGLSSWKTKRQFTESMKRLGFAWLPQAKRGEQLINK